MTGIPKPSFPRDQILREICSLGNDDMEKQTLIVEVTVTVTIGFSFMALQLIYMYVPSLTPKFPKPHQRSGGGCSGDLTVTKLTGFWVSTFAPRGAIQSLDLEVKS